MSTALGYLFLLLPVVAIAWIVWSYQRKAGDKAARTREREMALVGLVRTADKASRAAPMERSAAGADAPPSAAPVAATPPPAATATRRDRFLSPTETLVYYLLRTGMPGYEVFPRASLASVVAVAPGVAGSPPAASDTQDLDFVVCDKSMHIVAAIRLAGRPAGPDSARVEQSLAAAGIRLVTIDPKALPKREALGALILG